MNGVEKVGLWMQWIVLSSVSWLVAFILGSWIGGYAGVGIAQWYTLRRLPQAIWWLGLSVVGSVLGWLLSTFVVGVLSVGMGVEFLIIADVVGGGLVGFTLGLLQWFYLRRLFDQAGLWIAASIVGWSLGPFLSLRIVWYGPVAAVVTGLTLAWLLRQPRPEVEFLNSGASSQRAKADSFVEEI
jgi:NhaP-type Na+/H+ or K+/H+ antiporter